MWNKKLEKKVDFEIKKLWETRNGDIERMISNTKCAECVKCGMIGLKHKMKDEDVIFEDKNIKIYDSSIPPKNGEAGHRFYKKIVTEYTCVHCLPKTKK